MQARDVMSAQVVAVESETPVMQIAALLREHRIGGVPVLRGEELVGIVTEKDLLHRHEIDTDRVSDAQSWWRRVVGHNLEPDWYVKSHGRCAQHVMTRRVITATPETPLRAIAALFDSHRIGRVPVVVESRLVGIVTGADLVKALAGGQWASGQARTATGDAEIRHQLLAELGRQGWWNGSISNVLVTDGVVLFNGLVENDAERRAAHVAAENVNGVRRVEDERLLISELPVMF
jgi:CBS domain-containing protein